MLNLKSEYLIEWDAKTVPDIAEADNHGYSRYYVTGGSMAGVYVGNDNGSDIAMAYFFKINTTGVTLASDDESHTNVQHDSRTNYVHEQHLLSDTDVLTETNGGNILQLANQFKDEFFEGVTQTPATLFAKMKEWHGNANGFYAPIGLAYNFLPINNLLYAATYTNIQNAFDRGDTPRFSHIYPGAVHFTGSNYGTFIQSFPAGLNDNEKDQYIIATLLFSDITAVDEANLQFDVYIQGTKAPTIDVKWNKTTEADFNLQTIAPQVFDAWRGIITPADSALYYTDTQSGVTVPRVNADTFRQKGFAWTQSDHFVYLTEFNSRYGSWSFVERMAQFGADGIANGVYLALRFNERMYADNSEVIKWGDLYEVYIPYNRQDNSECTVRMIANSRNGATFSTTCVLHFGPPPDDKKPGDDTPPPPPPTPPGFDPEFEPYEPTGFPGDAILTQTYCMNGTVLENVGSKLWSQSYWDVLKIQSNPIENIISCKWYPMNLDGVAREIKVGDISFGINGYKRANRYVSPWLSYTYTGNEATWDEAGTTYTLPKFMCCSPYTTLKLHLPYAGTVQLDASDMINNPLRVRYVVDLVTGDMLYFLQIGTKQAPFMTVAGKMGVDIPLTASNRAQTELASASKQLSAVIGAAGALMGGNVGGAAQAATSIVSAAGMDFTSQRTATHSPTCASFENTAIYLEISFPMFKESAGFKYSHGYPTHKWVTLKNLKGFVKVDARTKIDFAMTKEENDMIENALINGVYV